MYLNNSPGLLQDLTKAINGEYSAIQCYAYLIKNASTEEEKKVLSEIRQDEIRHFQEFCQVYATITGTQPTPRLTESCPRAYIEGLEAAFKDEQDTVDFYYDIAHKAEEPFIKETFKRAAADEQNHAVWFLFFQTKLHHKKNQQK